MLVFLEQTSWSHQVTVKIKAGCVYYKLTSFAALAEIESPNWINAWNVSENKNTTSVYT